MTNRVLVVDSPRALFEIAEVFGEIGIDRLVGDYLGDRPVMAENKWALWRMDSQGGHLLPGTRKSPSLTVDHSERSMCG